MYSRTVQSFYFIFTGIQVKVKHFVIVQIFIIVRKKKKVEKKGKESVRDEFFQTYLYVRIYTSNEPH